MLVGYARVSTRDQSPDLQLDALRAIPRPISTADHRMPGLAAPAIVMSVWLKSLPLNRSGSPVAFARA
jgi:hypothetical protein